MSHCKAFRLAIFAALYLLGETAGSAHAQCGPSPEATLCATEWSGGIGGSIISLGALPGFTYSFARGINDAGQVVGASEDSFHAFAYATEWSGGSVINLGGLSGSTNSIAYAINNAGQAVGYSVVGGIEYAAEWSGGRVINLGGLSGSTFSLALGINDSGQAVGFSGLSEFAGDFATEWSGGIAGSIINLGGLPGSTSSTANAINNAGQAVGYSYVGGAGVATEWSGGSVINLGGLPGSTFSQAISINNSGQAVGYSVVGDIEYATEWSGGSVINLGEFSTADGINDAGQVVGTGPGGATESSDGNVITLGGLSGYSSSDAYGINNVGKAVGDSQFAPVPPPPLPTPEPSTWAMMLLGFAGLGLAGYRRVKSRPGNSRARDDQDHDRA